MFKIFFELFREVMKNPEELKTVIFKKDRTKSKKDQMALKKKAMKKIKAIKENGDIDEQDNKIVELILKGVNILMLQSKQDLTIGGKDNELRHILETQMNTLFKLTHHTVFRIQIQVFKLLL